jgi:uncharacterized membrane protein
MKENIKQGRISSETVCRALLGVGVLAYILVFCTITFGLFDRLAYMNFDLGIFHQAVWLIAHGETPFVTMRGVHILGDHFSAVLYLIAPFYAIAPTPKTLLFIQTATLALGALPVYGIARLKSLTPPIALLFALVYLCHPALQWSGMYEFHPDTIATPCLLAVFYYLIAGKRWGMFLFAFLLCLTKETAGMSLVFVGFYALILRKKQEGLGLMAFGITMLIIAMLTVRHFNPDNHESSSPYTQYYSYWGDSTANIAKTILTSPQKIAPVFFYNYEYYGYLLVPVLFLALLAPEVLLVAIPPLCANLLSGHMGMNTIREHYTALITPCILTASVIGYARIENEKQKRANGFVKSAILSNLAIWSIGGMLLWGPLLENKAQLYSGRTLANAIETRQILSRIPQDASVSVQMSLGSHIAGRKHIYHYPNPFGTVVYGGTRQAIKEIMQYGNSPLPAGFAEGVAKTLVDYVAISPNTSRFPLGTDAYDTSVKELLQNPAYGIVSIGKGVIVFQKGADNQRGIANLQEYVASKSTDGETLLWAWIEKSGETWDN